MITGLADGAQVRIQGHQVIVTVASVDLGATTATILTSTGEHIINIAELQNLSDACEPCLWTETGPTGACKRCGRVVNGAERNRRHQTDYGEATTLVHAPTGRAVFRGPTSSHTYSIREVFCAACGVWTQQKGIVSFVRPTCPHCEGDLNREDAGTRT